MSIGSLPCSGGAIKEPYRAIWNVPERESSRHLGGYRAEAMETPRMSAQARREYVQAMYHRYRQAARVDEGRILTEFCAVVGYHRKSAVRLFTGPAPGAERPPRRRAVHYEAPTIEVRRAIWEAAGYPRSLRLKALLPLWLPWARRRWRHSGSWSVRIASGS
jgi:hypothetical protein